MARKSDSEAMPMANAPSGAGMRQRCWALGTTIKAAISAMNKHYSK